MAKKKKEKKESVSEIMEQIIDKDALAKRKAMAAQPTNKHQPTKRKLIKIEEPKWFQKPISIDCFEIKESKNGKFYAQHKEWKKNIYIGGYDTKDELNKVLEDYCKNSKRSPMNKKAVKIAQAIWIATTTQALCPKAKQQPPYRGAETPQPQARPTIKFACAPLLARASVSAPHPARPKCG